AKFRNRSRPSAVATQTLPSRSSKRAETESPESPSACENTSVLPWYRWIRPRSLVPTQRPPARSRNIRLTFALGTPRPKYVSIFLSRSLVIPSCVPINNAPSSPSAKDWTVSTALGIEKKFDAPGVHRHKPLFTPAQRLPLLSSYNPNTPTPRLPS